MTTSFTPDNTPDNSPERFFRDYCVFSPPTTLYKPDGYEPTPMGTDELYARYMKWLGSPHLMESAAGRQEVMIAALETNAARTVLHRCGRVIVNLQVFDTKEEAADCREAWAWAQQVHRSMRATLRRHGLSDASTHQEAQPLLKASKPAQCVAGAAPLATCKEVAPGCQNIC